MLEFLQQLINGLALGSIYALIALGYTMVYGVLRFINFAHSDVFMVGAFCGYYASKVGSRFLASGTVTAAIVVFLMSMWFAPCWASSSNASRTGPCASDPNSRFSSPPLVSRS